MFTFQIPFDKSKFHKVYKGKVCFSLRGQNTHSLTDTNLFQLRQSHHCSISQLLTSQSQNNVTFKTFNARVISGKRFSPEMFGLLDAWLYNMPQMLELQNNAFCTWDLSKSNKGGSAILSTVEFLVLILYQIFVC